MRLDITGRHMEITPALREFTEDKLQKLEKLLDGPIEAHVVLATEKHRHVAEIKVKSRTVLLSGTQETGDLYSSIKEVVDKLERQALKHKEKLHDYKHRKSPRDPRVAATIEANAAPGDEADGETPTGDLPAPGVVRNRGYRLKPMSVEDAVLDLEASGEELIVFRSGDTDRIAVLHRRQDGSYDLIEPES